MTVIHHCPYCGEEDLRPSEAEPSDQSCSARLTPRSDPDRSSAWECRSCTRVFTVKFVGLLSRKANR